MFKNWKWMLSAALSFALLFGLAGAAGAEDAKGASGVHITLLHTNDMHARAVEGLGFARVAGIFDSYRELNPNTLVVDVGDAIHGTTFATLVNGESVVDVMNVMGYDAMVPGNHEFNYGTDRLLELADRLVFPMLSANVRNKGDKLLFDPYIIKEVGGVKLGIFGLTTPETAYKTHPNNVVNVVFTDPASEAQAIVDELKGQVDVIIALGHLGIDESSVDTSLKVVNEVAGIDIFVDGHSHSALESGLEADNGTLIVSAGEYTKYVGVVDLWVGDGAVTARKAKLLNEETAGEIEANETVAALIAEIQESQQTILNEEVGFASVPLVGEREYVRAGETNLGNLLADALLFVTGADVSLTNGGGIRASIDEGVITKGEVITVLPFGNQIVTLNVSGADIKAALEHGASDYPNPKGAFPHIGGMSFQIDPAGEPGKRVHSVRIGNKALDDKAVYTLATNDFLAAGGDEYAMFGKYPQAGMFGSLDEALIAYIAELGTANPAVEGRISEGVLPGTTTPAPEPKPEQPVVEPKPEPAPLVHIVKKGDTLWAIARKNGTTWQTLRDLNQLRNPDLIFPGQRIILPG